MSTQWVEVGVVLDPSRFQLISSGGRQKEVSPHVLHRLLQAKESHLNWPPAVFDLRRQRFTGHVTRPQSISAPEILTALSRQVTNRTPMCEQSLLHGLLSVVRAELLRLLSCLPTNRSAGKRRDISYLRPLFVELTTRCIQ